MRLRHRRETSTFYDPAIGSLQARAWVAGAMLLAAAGAAALSIDDLIYDLHARYTAAQDLPALAQLYQAHVYLHQVALLVPVVCVGATVAWLAWQGRAQANLRRLDASGLRFHPAWAVASWFVPVGNIVLPYLVMRELWRASDPEAGADDWQKRRTTIVLPIWWLCLVGTAILFALGMRLDVGRGKANSQLITRDLLFIWSSAAAIVTAGLAGLLIKLVDDRQIGKSNRSQSGTWVSWTNRQRAS